MTAGTSKPLHRLACQATRSRCSRFTAACSLLGPEPCIFVYPNISLTLFFSVTATRSAATLNDLDSVFKGFADPTRIRLLSALAAGELCVCDLVDILGLPQPAVSRHLGYLRRTGLVEVTRDARFAHYRLAEPDNAVHQNLINCVRTCFRGISSLDKERRQAEARVKTRAMEPC